MTSQEHSVATVMVGGDVCPVGGYERLFCEARGDSIILGGLRRSWEAADLRVINLECPLIVAEAPILKTGRHLAAPHQAVRGLQALRVNVVGLANNHILDHGHDGVINTISNCTAHGISVVGAGANLSEASRPLILNVNGNRLAIMAFADAEWSLAGCSSAGANPFSFPSFLKAMHGLRGRCDFLMVLLHMGKEHYAYPSPELQVICRCLVNEGVNIVVCQHSHCAGACEYYAGGFICYGQGNMIFDCSGVARRSWYLGYLLRIVLAKGSRPGVTLIPYEQQQGNPGLQMLNPTATEEIRNRVEHMEQQIQDSQFVQEEWTRFCEKNRRLYFSILRGHQRAFRGVNKILGIAEHLYSDNGLAVLENVVRCQAHREVLQEVLSKAREKRQTRTKRKVSLLPTKDNKHG